MNRASRSTGGSALTDLLRLRADLAAAIREFFAQRGVLEVHPPCLGPAAMDPALASVAADAADGDGNQLYLQTSPESAMKRLLSAGSGDIYYLGPVWRGGEQGRWHSVEFTLLEWYRVGYSHYDLMAELAELIEHCRISLSKHKATVPAAEGCGLAKRSVEYLSYRQACLDQAGVDPLTVSREQLQEAIARAGIELHSCAANSSAGSEVDLDRDELLDLLLSHVVAMQLGHSRITFLTAFPASQAALARLDEADPRTARRFELFMDGLEIANGYHELTDPGAQRQRFKQEQQQRRAAGSPVHELDHSLLAALERGLPDCAGVAVGFDRLLAVFLGADSLAEVRSE
ncbi:EF-P lysine aminoacylase EpmA [Halorhodospira halochloris]|uniref:EF-P lysine aminoacylase EpmA n=1 Tax=Halorhodospira halochloris TaxID=1052 RepID=UPI001EE8039E|nr:EF-P lysine aminoacylase EpmA [Halorhodospira halochloris]MCG5547801.1 EF-P lysine aminoacylase GenX [Halorhodospira halochloris]